MYRHTSITSPPTYQNAYRLGAGAIVKYFTQECLRLRGDKLLSVRPKLDVEVTREPVGVVGIIAQWNFPVAIHA